VDKLLEQKLVELIENFQSAASAGGKAVAQALPQITDYAIRIKYWECLGQVILGVVFILIGFLIFATVTRIAWKASSKFEEYYWNTGDVISFASAAVSLILVIAGSALALNYWNWAGIVEPRVALAHDIYVTVLQKLGN